MAQKRAAESGAPISVKTSRTANRPSASIVGISRTIAACQRCRQKKTKCDQQFPNCARCSKAGVDCVGLDPATGRQIPRSYVISLEDRIAQLEQIIKDNGIDPNGNAASDHPFNGVPNNNNNNNHSHASTKTSPVGHFTPLSDSSISPPKTETKERETIKSSLEFNNANGVSFYLGDSSGISFAKLLFTAVNFSPASISENNSITTKVPTAKSQSSTSAPVPLPDKQTAESLIKSYFEQSNTQLTVLHREHFINHHFEPIYGNLSSDIKLASNYTKMNIDNDLIDDYFYRHIDPKLRLTSENVPEIHHKSMFFLNMVFAIASSINLLSSKDPEISNAYKNQAMRFADSVYQSSDRLECLQCLLLLTLFSIMRPSTPGCWYILGTTLRLCVDLGLHTEKLNHQFVPYIKDMRRRLFWCAYSLDRQICVYLGRPFGIPEASISTKFPVDMDDCLIHTDETQDYTISANSLPSYKTISINFFKVRKIQSEILQVLYFPNSQLSRKDQTLDQWKERINNQLESWFKTIPLKSSRKFNSDFNFEFFKLNYYHTQLLLFGVTPKNNNMNNNTLRILFSASRGIIGCYHELFKGKTINYTWAAVHNLFMAGISFFFAIYKSTEKFIELADFENDIKMVLIVLNSLVESCDAASSCVEIFEILSRVIVKLKFETEQEEEEEEEKKQRKIGSNNIGEIERFFQKLNDEEYPHQRRNSESVPSFAPQQGQTQLTKEEGKANSFDDLSYPSLSTPPVVNGMDEVDFEQMRIFELMNQVSGDTIWDQFFSTKGTNDFLS